MHSVLVCAILLMQQVYTNSDFVRTQGSSLQARFDAAVEQGRRGSEDTFWVAYQFPVRDGIRVDARSGGLNVTRPSDGIEWVPDDTAPQRVGLFLLVRKADGGVDHGRILDLGSNYRFHDRRVYWAGEGQPAESLDLLTRLSGDPKTSTSILTVAISMHDTSRAIDKLVVLTGGAYPSELRRSAINQLGQETSRSAGDALNRLALDSTIGVELQRAAVVAIGHRANADSIPALIKIAQDHPDTSIRRQAVNILGQKHDPGAIAFLEQQLRQK
jgi:hypothetical protein